MNSPLFSAKVAVLLVALAVALFSLSIIFGAYEQPRPDNRAGPGAFSTSAVGYASLYHLLERLDWQVERGDRPEDMPDDGILVLAEPANPATLAAVLREAGAKTLVVLPKWTVSAAAAQSRWVSEVRLIPPHQTDSMLAVVVAGATTTTGSWPEVWRDNEFNVTPSGEGTVRLVHSDRLRPLIGNADGILLGEMRLDGMTIWLLSDPDVMSNHGLGVGDNASFMLALLRRLAGDTTPSVVRFDETLHGYREKSTNPLRLMIEFPLVLVTVAGVVTALLLAWSGAVRFGQPERPTATAGFGKEQLIDNSARLAALAGHQRQILERYVRSTIQTTAVALHAPDDRAGEELTAWLDRIGRARGVTVSAADIWRRATRYGGEEEALNALLACAREAYRWRTAILGQGGGEANSGDRSEAAS